MFCISSVNYHVVVNGKTSNSFKPGCGIRQGDPISPYIFVLCMEKLSHLIVDSVSKGLWKPIRISRGGPLISHLFFADDLILFGYASLQQANAMKDCLDLFCSYSGQQKPVHLINWATVCKPKCRGGLGIKQTKLMNQALLAKAGWRILKHDQGVWCKLLRNKYLTKSSITDGGGQKHAACSNVWRGIQHGASLVAKGIRWRFGNGHSIMFWSDVWVKSLGPLRDYAIIDVCDNIAYSTVSSFIVDNIWDIERLAAILPWQVVHRIACIFISSDMNVVDSVIWGCDGQGEFSVKSAYNNLLLDDVNLRDWRFV
ncbi:hypothetical protein ACOSP7_032603 [Xanthoceras sorbifolium]